ncbi:MAG: hypothetical protein ACLVIY_07400 [Anaerobutyricum soehngenii]
MYLREAGKILELVEMIEIINYSGHYQDTELVLYEKYTYEDVCRFA